jgi:hypothetical protein
VQTIGHHKEENFQLESLRCDGMNRFGHGVFQQTPRGFDLFAGILLYKSPRKRDSAFGVLLAKW